ncbi:MAG: TraX protein [Lachnoclostridium sp.]|jgi:hypothetical protein
MNGCNLKYIAMITMFIDHLAAILLPSETPVYLVFRIIGRLAFPIFCFLLIEGFRHTHSVKNYLTRLGIFAFISEIPFDLAFTAKYYGDYWQDQNVFFTLFIGLAVIWGMSIVDKKFYKDTFQSKFLNRLLQGIVVMTGCFAAFFLKTDYSYMGIFLIVVFYLFREKKALMTFFVLLVNLFLGGIIQAFATLALVFTFRYNGERGPQANKYLFYIFYPAHILFLYLISLLPIFT